MAENKAERGEVLLSLGIEGASGQFVRVIERHSRIPTRHSVIISTTADNQPSLSILIFQGERAMAGDNRLLGQFELSGIPPAPRGVPQIEVTFDLDARGVLQVTASDPTTGKMQRVVVNIPPLTLEEVESVLQETAFFAANDRQRSILAESRRNASYLIQATRRDLQAHGGKIEDSLRAELGEALSACEVALQDDDVERLQAATAILQNLVQSLYEYEGQLPIATEEGEVPHEE